MKPKIKWVGIAIASFVFLWGGNVSANPYFFGCISFNSPANCSTGEAQLSVHVTDPGGGQVLFTFSNSGPIASTIAEIYFDDGLGSLTSLVSIDNSDPGVMFSPNGTPTNIPARGNITPEFQTTHPLTASADSPATVYGVDPGESVGLTYDLDVSKTFSDIINEINNGNLRTGMHVISIGGGVARAL